jgi:hypothetical protein
MRLSVPRLAGPPQSGNPRSKKEILRWIIFLALLIVIVSGAWYLISGHKKSKDQALTTAQFQQAHSHAISKSLAVKDYAGYQETQSTLASQYIGYKNYSAAESLMNDIFNNVPTDKIESGTYTVMYSLQKAKGDTAGEKKYLKLLIAKLNAEGDSQDAADYQATLNKLQ